MKHILLVTLILFHNCLYGQNKLTGAIVSKNSGIPDVNVLLYRVPDSVMVKGTITDSTGAFEFTNLSLGNYFIKTYHANFRDSIITIPAGLFLSSAPFIIELVPNSEIALKEVAISSRKPLIERKADRLIFNVENSITSIGGDGMDALSKTPGLRVNGDNISIIGKSSVQVMVNDRLLEIAGADLVNYLKALSTDNISAIEVITNPPARYDAQGNSGLINIRLKKNNKEGWSIGLRSSYIQATYPNISGGATIDYKKNKLTFHAGVNANEGSVAPVSNEFIFYPTQSWYQTDHRRDYSKYISAQVSLDYQLSRNSVAGFSYTGSGGMPDMKENINTPIFNTNNTIDSSLKTNAFTTRRTAYQSIDAYYQCKLDTLGKKISVDGNYSTFSDNRNKTYNIQTFDDNGLPVIASYKQYKNNGDQDGNIFTVKGDVDLPYKTFSLSLGGKLTAINNTSGFNLYNSYNGNYFIDTAQSNNFIYQEHVQAIYASIDKNINRWEIQGGLRGEMTEIKAYSPTLDFTNTNQYFKVFPTFLINYKADDNNTFSLNYGKRIDRPSYWDLNPFRWYFSQYAYAEGNPYLQPSYNNNLELDYTYKDFFTASVFYSLGTNLQDRIIIVTSNSDTQKNIVRNFLTTNSCGASFTYIFNKVKWLENNDQFQVYYSQSQSSLPETIHSLQGICASLSSGNSIILNKNKTILGEIDFAYQFAGIDGVDRSSSFYNVDAGMKFKILNKKMDISAVITDIFKSNAATYYSAVNNINQSSYNYFDSRRFNLTIKYKFGNDKLKTTEHQAGNQEETGRIK